MSYNFASRVKRNGKLALALHTLGHMALEPSQRMRSEDIALHNCTNPVVVRRVLGWLRDVGLVTSERGHAGGWMFAKPAREIALSDVYVALEDPQFSSPASVASPCAIEARLFQAFADATAAAEKTMIAELSRLTLQDLADAMTPGTS